MRVRTILDSKTNPGIVSVRPDDSIRTAVERLQQHGIGVLVVLGSHARIAGILSERDVVRGLARQGPEVLHQRVEQLMSRPIHTCKPDDEIKDVMTWMTNFRVRHLPVIDEGRLVGMVSIGDVVKHRLTEMETEANVLRDILLAR